jgi:hypothetical protein
MQRRIIFPTAVLCVCACACVCYEYVLYAVCRMLSCPAAAPFLLLITVAAEEHLESILDARWVTPMKSINGPMNLPDQGSTAFRRGEVSLKRKCNGIIRMVARVCPPGGIRP